MKFIFKQLDCRGAWKKGQRRWQLCNKNKIDDAAVWAESYVSILCIHGITQTVHLDIIVINVFTRLYCTFEDIWSLFQLLSDSEELYWNMLRALGSINCSHTEPSEEVVSFLLDPLLSPPSGKFMNIKCGCPSFSSSEEPSWIVAVGHFLDVAGVLGQMFQFMVLMAHCPIL